MIALPLVVAGCGRCGSSLVMQMLAAGGVPTTGRFPAYEDADLVHAFEASGVLPARAVKVLAPFVSAENITSAPPSTSWVWVRRSLDPLWRSQQKFAALIFGAELGRDKRAAALLRDQLMREDRNVPAAIQRAGRPLLVVSFEDVLADPAQQARRLARFSGLEGFDVDAAAGVVVERSPDCYDGFLETKLVDHHTPA